MNAGQVRAYLRSILGESEATAVTEAGTDGGDLNIWLARGYERYWNKIRRNHAELLTVRADITFANAREYNLSSDAVPAPAVSVLGAAPTSRRMIQLLQVLEMTTDGAIQRVLRSVGDLGALDLVDDGYYYRAGVIVLSDRFTGTLRLLYVPEPNINWATALDSAFVDDFTQWHDVIALMAARHYMMRDHERNKVIEDQLRERLEEFEEWAGEFDLEAGRYFPEPVEGI